MTPWRVGRVLGVGGVLAVGGLLAAGGVVYFNMTLEKVVSSTPPAETIDSAIPSRDRDTLNIARVNESSGATHRLREELRAADRQEDFQEMVRYWNRLKRDAEATAPARSVDSEYRFMDLEDEPLSVEFLRTYVYPEEQPSRSEATSSHQQEIERLEGEISALLAEARQDPTTDPSELDREIQRLDYQIDMLRLAAMEQQ